MPDLTLYRINRIDGATIGHNGEVVYAFTLTDCGGSSLNIGVDAKLLNRWISLAREMESKGLDYQV